MPHRPRTLRLAAIGLLAGAFQFLAYGASPLYGQQELVDAGIDAWNSEQCAAGDCTAAYSFFVQAAGEMEAGDPARPEVLGYVIRAAFRGGSDGIVTHIWEYLKEGRTVAATNHALAALTDPQDRYGDESEDLLMVMAVGLSMQAYDPTTFPGAASQEAFEALQRRPDIGPGVREMLAWHSNPDIWARLDTAPIPPVQPDSTGLTGCSEGMLGAVRAGPSGAWEWWGTTPVRPSSLEVPRREVGRGLIAQIGEWYLRQEEWSTAENFLCVAALLEEDEIMDYAFRDLVWTYVGAGNPNRLKALEQRVPDQFHSVDQDYLKPIEDAYNFHPWYRKRRYIAPPAALLIGGAVCWFVFDSCGRGGADGQVVVTIP